VAANQIVAAGAVVTRESSSEREFLLVHRGYRNDWTFPKGKVDPGEHIIAAAIREVREETGYAIALGVPLPTQQYTVKGDDKFSHYWLATCLDGEFEANDEVDEIKWVSYKQAAKLLTYPHDREVLDAAAAAPVTTALIILRHTQATKRAEWAVTEDALAQVDSSRPLTAVGRMQASGLVPAIAAFGVTKLHSSDSRRCRDTVGPYAGARSLAITLEEALSEEEHLLDPVRAQKRVSAIASTTEPVLLCTHRPVMPTVMDTLHAQLEVSHPDKKDFDPALTPGSMVIFHRDAANPAVVHAVERHIH
jgi:8-oxo-dGTP diphosphatase